MARPCFATLPRYRHMRRCSDLSPHSWCVPFGLILSSYQLTSRTASPAWHKCSQSPSCHLLHDDRIPSATYLRRSALLTSVNHVFEYQDRSQSTVRWRAMAFFKGLARPAENCGVNRAKIKKILGDGVSSSVRKGKRQDPCVLGACSRFPDGTQPMGIVRVPA